MCMGKKVRLNPKKISQNDTLPMASFISRPNIFGVQ